VLCANLDSLNLREHGVVEEWRFLSPSSNLAFLSRTFRAQFVLDTLYKAKVDGSASTRSRAGYDVLIMIAMEPGGVVPTLATALHKSEVQ
jgi:hypothetical protein